MEDIDSREKLLPGSWTSAVQDFRDKYVSVYASQFREKYVAINWPPALRGFDWHATMEHFGATKLANRRVAIKVLIAFGILIFLRCLYMLSFFTSSSHLESPRYAIVSNVHNELYLPLALVLGYSIKKYNPHLSQRSTDLVLLLPKDNDITPYNRARLEKIGWKLREEEDIYFSGIEGLKPAFQRNFIKYKMWNWTEYSKIAFIDADCLVEGDISLLLSDGYDFGCVPDTWPEEMPAYNFNAGVLSIKPSSKTYAELLNFTSVREVPFDAEQGILNQFYLPPAHNERILPEYTRTILPMKYNLNLEAYASHREQWDDLWPDARVIHYTMRKPTDGDCVEGAECRYEQPMRTWWREHDEMAKVYGWRAWSHETGI